MSAYARIKRCLEVQDSILDLRGCALIDTDFASDKLIGIEFRKCSHLRVLKISENHLTEIMGLECLTSLQKLDIYGNRITEIKGLEKLTSLQELDLSKNELTEIKGLEKLTSLRELDISKNELTEIKGLEKLTSLQKLDISKNELTEIKGLEKLTSLQNLFIYDNWITEIKGLEKLTSLRRLYIHDNELTEVKGLDGLTSLQELAISGNKLNEIKGLEKLVSLQRLYINDNKLLEMKGLENLIKLQELYIHENKIKIIDNIIHLTDLQVLNIGENEINDIAPLLPFVQRTKNPLKIVCSDRISIQSGQINVAGNNLVTPPIEIIKQGNAAILRYFERIHNEGVDYLYEAKLTLVGEGAAGKTSLQKRLMNGKDPLPQEDNRTRGIKIEKWQFEGKKNQACMVHIWDFGGQDVYYPVHRFFLTENSVFVLLASTRQTNHNFDYWIPAIFQYGGKSPIILGQTCHQGNKVAWNDLDYYFSNKDFNIIKAGQLRPYIEVNLPNNNEGLDEINKTIIEQIEKLPHFGKGVPKSWVQARAAIFEKAKSNACITFEDFASICTTTNQDKFSTQQDAEDFAEFLHSLGIILWYSGIGELKGWVILQPEWAMNAVYKIIDDEVIQKQRGNILSEDFKRVWSEECYRYKFDILKRMLQIFKIAFPKKHEKDGFIIPARLDSIPKEAEWDVTEPTLQLRYSFDFMPRGLVNQLSADLSDSIQSDNTVWNNAVNFEYKDTKTQAQIIENYYDRTVNIYARGKDARGMVMIIMHAMRGIIADYKGVLPEINVPCFCEKCNRGNKNMTLFKYERLLEWSKTKEEVYCNEGNVFLSIHELLFNVGLPNPFAAKRNKELKAFISYSKFDGELNKNGINYLEDFKTHLAPLRTHSNLMPWDDTCLIAGDEWDNKIRVQLGTCDIIFLLVSANFLNTRYIKDVELDIAIKRQKNGECIIVPVIVSACGWNDVEILKDLQVLPRKDNTIASWKNNSDWQNIDDAWNYVYEEVKKVIAEFRKK